MNQIKNIKIKRIKLHNFLIFEDFEANFDLINIVSGKNASGKSTLTSEAIYFNLFGRPLRTTKVDELLSYYKDSGYVEVLYELEFINGKNFLIQIKRGIKSDTSISCLNCTNDDLKFLSSMYNIFNFKNINDLNSELKFLFITPEDFLKLSLKSPFSKTSVTDKNLIHDLIDLNEVIEFHQKLNSTKKHIKNIFDIKKQEYKKIEQILKEEQIDKDKIINEEKKILNEIYKKIKKISLILEKLRKQKNEIERRLEILEASKNEYIKKSAIYKSKMETLKKQYDKEKAMLDKNLCPMCHQKINDKIIKNKLKEIKADFSDTKHKYIKNNTSLKIIQDNSKKLENKLNNIIDKIQEYEIALSKLNAEIKNINKRVNNLENSTEKQSIEKIKDELENELKELKNDYNMINNNIQFFDKNKTFFKSFINKKIRAFNYIFSNITRKLSNGKLDANIVDLNKIIVDYRNYNLLSTSEKKTIDIAFTIAYIIYNLQKNKMPLILDEFFDNFDEERTKLIFNEIINIVKTNNKQIIVTTNYFENLKEFVDLYNINVIDLTKNYELKNNDYST